MERGSDVKFGIVVGALRVTDVFSVDPHVGTTINTVEVEEHALAVPVGGKIEVATVASHGIGVYFSAIFLAQFNVGRIVFENVVHIYVDRFVISLHFPARGHVDVVPCCSVVVVLDKSGVAFCGIGCVVEFPSSVERLHFGGVRVEPCLFETRIGLQSGRGGVGHERGMSVFLVDGEDRFVLPLRFGLLHALVLPILHLGEAELRVVVRAIAHIDLAFFVHTEQIEAVGLRNDAVHTILSLHRFEHETLVGVALVGIPLQRFAGPVESQVHGFLVIAVVDQESSVACVEELEHLRGRRGIRFRAFVVAVVGGRISVAQIEIVRHSRDGIVLIDHRLCECKDSTHTPEQQDRPKPPVSRVGELFHDRKVRDKLKNREMKISDHSK